MKFIKVAMMAAVPFALAFGSPASAQDARGVPAQTAPIFTAEPLTAEQESRLPAAEMVVDKIFPPGTYMKMMDESMKPMMDAIMGQVGALPVASLMRMTGLPESEIADMSDATLSEVMNILDPVYEDRRQIITDTTMSWMGELMNQMEPSFRAGLSRAYAVRFEEAELRELSVFFTTPTGAHYAEESMLIMMDPQVMSAMGEMMPAMMESMPQMLEALQGKMESLPRARQPADLSEEERARLSELLGISTADM